LGRDKRGAFPGVRSKIRRSSGVILRLKTLVKIRSIGNGSRLTIGNNQGTDSAAYQKSQFNEHPEITQVLAAQSQAFTNVSWGTKRTRNIGAGNYLLCKKSGAGKGVIARQRERVSDVAAFLRC
jgi:hypothetical protein